MPGMLEYLSMSSIDSLFMPKEHYSINGNRVVAEAIVERLKAGTPRVFAADGQGPSNAMWIDPLNLQEGEVEVVAERFRTILIEAASGR